MNTKECTPEEFARLMAENERISHERDAAVAVLEGMEFTDIPLLLKKSVDYCRGVGVTAKELIDIATDAALSGAKP